MFTTEPFWILWWQSPGEKKKYLGIFYVESGGKGQRAYGWCKLFIDDFLGYRS